MANAGVTVNLNPETVHEARDQWERARALAIKAERIYNAAIENGLPERVVRECPDCGGAGVKRITGGEDIVECGRCKGSGRSA